MVLGLVTPTAGHISILGESDAAKVRNRIGFLPEERGLYRRMTPLNAIAFLAGLKGVAPAEAKRRARALLESQGLGEAIDRPIRSLSKGMAQKVQLLSTLAHELKRRGGGWGLATMCIGVGQGIAVVLDAR